MFETIYSQIGTAITILVVVFAFLKGDEPERFASAAFGFVVLVGVVGAVQASGNTVLWGQMALDMVLLAVFAGLAWQSRRNWLIWATAFQSLIVTGHILTVAHIRPPGNAFAAVNNLSNYGLLVAIAVGTFWAWQERRAAGLEK